MSGLNESRRSYDYRALCDVCRFKMWASELKLRWDGLWCCEKDWEVRHPSDFYRNRNDVHKLPFIRNDTGETELVWTSMGAVTNLTSNLATNEQVQQPDGVYMVNGTTGLTKGHIVHFQFLKSIGATDTTMPVLSQPQSTSTNGGTGTITLPTTPSGAGNLTYSTSYGLYLGTRAFSGGSASISNNHPTWTKKPGHLIISFSYIT